jgi:hypothetical protein
MSKIKRFNEFIDNHLKFYAFDIDDNILKMPTIIHMENLVEGKWIKSDVSTSDFSLIRNKSDWRILENSITKAFSEFRDDGIRGDNAFLSDLKLAIEQKQFGPAWEDFIECITSGALFSLITARGHESSSIRKGVEYIIDNLDSDQQYLMYNNLLKFAYIFKSGEYNRILKGVPSQNLLVKEYLDNCDYVGVSAPSRNGDPSNPEKEKEIAFLQFKDKINKFASSVGLKAMVGFSDDDIKNINHIEESIGNLHMERFPSIIRYVIKNTNNLTKTTFVESSNLNGTSILPFTQFGNFFSHTNPAGPLDRQDNFADQHIKKTNYLAKSTKDYVEEDKKKKQKKFKRTKKKS